MGRNMRRPPLYSATPPAPLTPDPQPTPTATADAAPQSRRTGRLQRWRERHPMALSMLASLVVALAVVGGYAHFRPVPRAINQKDIDAAVQHTLEHNVTPSPAAQAYEQI